MVDLPYENPFQAPGAPVLERPEDPGSLRPVPWEDLETHPGFWGRVGGMFSLLFSNPMGMADRVPVTDGLAPAWRFNILMAVPYLVFTGLMLALVGSVFAFMPKDPNMPKGVMGLTVAGEGLFILAWILSGMFVCGAIVHCALWMWGGTREGRGLGQSVRACGYLWGFVNLGMLLPCLNLFVMIGGIVYLGMGLARVHRTETWRGICAAFTPFLLCCFCYGAFLALAISLPRLMH